ncbi:MAG: branched-chain amino acid ABC transporter permease [Chloroflexi bacterium]|nr:MAG: branched-chain amino acid ABC transporter permease [Chloroflexota bacterium]
MSNQRPTFITIFLIIMGLLAFSFFTTGSLSDFAITVTSGLFQGMLLFLVAAGLSIVFGLMDVLNLAQGAYFMVGAYVGYEIHHWPALAQIVPDANLRFPVAIIVATLIGGALGYLLERILLRPLYDRPLFQLVVTFGVGLIFTEGVKFIWGVTPRAWRDTFGLLAGQFHIFEASFTTYRPFVIVVGLVLIVAIALFLRRTRTGIIIRAGVEDSEMVEALGINVRNVFTMIFALGCAIAAMGGAVAAPFFGANIELGNQFLLAAVAVVVLGGLGSYEGTAIASIIVGLAVAVVAQFVSSEAINQPVWASLTPMIVLALVLLLRPTGLFGKERSHG